MTIKHLVAVLVLILVSGCGYKPGDYTVKGDGVTCTCLASGPIPDMEFDCPCSTKPGDIITVKVRFDQK